MAFMRMYGYEGDPGPRPVPKRKQAGAGPKAKASRKRLVRAKRAQRGMQGAPKGPGKGKGLLGPGAVEFLRQAGSTALELVPGGGLARVGARAAGRAIGAFRGGAPGAGGGRRSINVANVKALKRSLRRLEGFKKLVKRVDKMLPVGARMTSSPSKGRAGHKRGCKCVGCR